MKLNHKPGIFERLGLKHAQERDRKLRRAVPAYLCLVDLKAQRGCAQDWHTLMERIVYGLALAREFFQHEVIDEVHRALTTITLVHSTAPGRANLWYLTPREASVIGPALVLTDRMEDLCDSKELANARQVAQRYMAPQG